MIFVTLALAADGDQTLTWLPVMPLLWLARLWLVSPIVAVAVFTFWVTNCGSSTGWCGRGLVVWELRIVVHLFFSGKCTDGL